MKKYGVPTRGPCFYLLRLTAYFFLGAAFFALGLETAFLGFGAFGFFGDLVAFLAFALGFLGVVALAFLAVTLAFLGDAAGLAFFAFSAAGNLKEPLAPVPLTWMRRPSATAFFKNFRMKRESFLSTSILLLAAMDFLMATKEDPLRSLEALTACITISLVFGCAGLVLGFFVAGAFLGAAETASAAAAIARGTLLAKDFKRVDLK